MNHDVTDFESEVIARSHTVPVLVDFWAPWCGPCKMLAPALEKLAAQAAGRWVLAKVNTDEQPAVAQQFGIRGIPNVKLFRNGQILAEFSGALPEPQLRRWLDENLPSEIRDAMSRARELLAARRSAEASALLQPLVDAQSADPELAALLARATVFADPAAAMALAESVARTSPGSEDVEIVQRLGRAFADAAEAEKRLPPSGLREQYITGLKELRREDFDAGLAALIDVLLEKPNYDDGRARAAAGAVLKHLGVRHPIAEKYSRRYTMAVNV